MPLRAIDCHVHPWDEVAIDSVGAERAGAMSKHFGQELTSISLAELADAYREREMMAVLLGSDDSTTSGLPPIPNAHLAQAVREHPDVFIGFGSVDPWKGKLALDELKRIADQGLKGLKFNPGRQHFFPNDPRFYPMWQLASDLGLIPLFHTGMMGNGAGTRGGLGFKLKYTAPIPYLDDVAADFPDLTMISAHPAWPWVSEQIAFLRHKANVYLDLSGWAPKYFPDEIVRDVNRGLQDRVLFGSDWPMITPERWVSEFEELDLKPEVKQKVLLTNAAKLFGISV